VAHRASCSEYRGVFLQAWCWNHAFSRTDFRSENIYTSNIPSAIGTRNVKTLSVQWRTISEEVWIGFAPQGGTQNLQRRFSRFIKLVTTWDLHSSGILQITYRRFGTAYLSHLQSKSSWTYWPSNMVPIGCPETSAQNYHFTLRNTPEECRSHLRRGGSLKSGIFAICSVIYSRTGRGIFNRSLWLETSFFWQPLVKAFQCCKCTT
jgi:hypothetical protein